MNLVYFLFQHQGVAVLKPRYNRADLGGTSDPVENWRQWSVMNTVRKYYHDLLAKRKPGSDGTPDAPIPPMA